MSLKQLWQEFKAFAFKGNMIDLAVAVVIGAAFSAVINSLVKDIIMPSISYVTVAASEAAGAATDAAKHATSTVGLTTKPAETQPSTQPGDAAPPPPPPPPAAAPPAPPADAKPVDIAWKIGRIEIGRFIAELINFVLVAFAVFIIIVKLLGSVMKRMSSTPAASEPVTKECRYCLSIIPIKATKCAHCTADLTTPAPGSA